MYDEEICAAKVISVKLVFLLLSWAIFGLLHLHSAGDFNYHRDLGYNYIPKLTVISNYGLPNQIRAALL